jgi:hypothetical protein
MKEEVIFPEDAISYSMQSTQNKQLGFGYQDRLTDLGHA